MQKLTAEQASTILNYLLPSIEAEHKLTRMTIQSIRPDLVERHGGGRASDIQPCMADGGDGASLPGRYLRSTHSSHGDEAGGTQRTSHPRMVRRTLQGRLRTRFSLERRGLAASGGGLWADEAGGRLLFHLYECYDPESRTTGRLSGGFDGEANFRGFG